MKVASIIVAGLLLSQVSIAQDAGRLVSRYGKSVATIATYDGDGRLQGVGTGFIIEKGVIVTSEHIVRDAEYIGSTFSDAKEGGIKGVMAADAASDLALLETSMRGNGLIISERRPEVGSEIVVIGSPMGLQNNVTRAQVSAFRSEGDLELFQLSEPLSEGSSGSPVLNLDGEVIGVITSKFGSEEGLRFAVSVGHLQEVLGSASPAAEGEQGGSRYAIVVASETTESSANEVARTYREKGYAAQVLASEVGGTRRFRVCLGSYEEKSAADDDRNRLAGVDLPDDAWVIQVP